ncbi:DUF2069 domain-containing protein [Pseudomonas jilinensis]|uniref:DUF2069 domain-containing protein n=1 Tax=Pseudomonas jilinensis TaxID=2078689 RepID=A0A396S576_9PSED|nr:DUF2069 domain-containing protein [Pseudomonas jilinensis]RHW21843.1 DUF2069 domain-containing protein [Pseudomonas jilinensis]
MPRAEKPLPSLEYLRPRMRLCRFVAAVSYFGLITSLLVHTLLFDNLNGANPLVILAVLLVPLLIFLPGILSGNPRVHAWLCFAINLYFIQGVLICFQPGREFYGSLLISFSMVYFLAALGYVRWAFQARRVEAAVTSP